MNEQASIHSMAKTDDPKAQEVMARNQTRKIKRHVEATQWVMSDPKGRLFVEMLLEQTNLNTTVFDPNGQQMAKKAGKQEVGHWLKELAIRCAGYGAWAQMEKEDIETKVKDDAEMKVELEKIEKQKKVAPINRR